MSVPKRARASAVCVQAGRLLCVQLRDPTSQIARLFVPGGAIEAGEDPARAAARETLEETGYHVTIDAARTCTARYEYVWDGQPRLITTQFFRATLLDPTRAPEPVHDRAYNEGTCWLPLQVVPRALGFQLDIAEAVHQLLEA